MKPLSEQELREKIVDLVYDAIEYGEELHTGHVKTVEEIKKDFGKLLSTVDSIVGFILSDRKAYGEQLVQKILNHSEQYYDSDGEPTQAVSCGQIENERNKMRQRNQGAKLMPTLSSVPEETPAEILKSNVELIISDYLGGQWNGNMRDDLVTLINQQIKSVLDELEGEVIGGDESSGIFPEIGESSTIRDNLRAEQRQAIQKIRSRYE